jgi:hypothetical protein
MKLKMTLMVGLALVLLFFMTTVLYQRTPHTAPSPAPPSSPYPHFIPLGGTVVTLVVLAVFIAFVAAFLLSGMIARKKESGEISTENLCPRCSAKNDPGRETCSSCGHFLK